MRSRLWADTDPIDSIWSRLRAVRFNCDFEARAVKSVNKSLIELKEGLAARAYDEGACNLVSRHRPGLSHRLGKFHHRQKPSSTGSVGPDKLCIAEWAN